MLKLLVLLALVLAVVYFFTWLGRRRPGDWGRDEDGDGPVIPTGRIGLEDDRRPPPAPRPKGDLEDAGEDRRRRD